MEWKQHDIDGGWPTMTGMAAGDVNNDGKTDIGITCSEFGELFTGLV